MDEKQTAMWDALADLEAETVVRIFVNWHGLQLLDDDFYDYLVDEGVLEEVEDE